MKADETEPLEHIVTAWASAWQHRMSAQLVALCATDCALNDRLGVTHVCVHPELAADAVFPSLGALVLGFVGALPFFWLMHHDDSALVLLGQMGFVIAVGTFVGTQPTIMVEAAPVAVRCTAIALGYNVTLGVVGGLTPLAATWIIERTGNDYSPAFMVMAAAVISFVALVSFKETYKMPLEVA